MKKFIVTGGYGFIGSSFIRKLINNKNVQILNIDNLTYAANKKNLDIKKKNLFFKKIDINNFQKVSKIFKTFSPDYVINFAAESHVDRSIDSPKNFFTTNVMGVFNLLEASREYLNTISHKKRKNFRFLHISTDEVYGDLKKNEKPFSEKSPYKPSSPYAASKASSDHLVKAWFRTFQVPILITNCSNNFGPYQHPEKLIPHVIISAINGKKIPIYGNGKQVRDWIHVDDHVDKIKEILFRGKIGNTYNIGANNQLTNLYLVKKICRYLNKKINIKPKGIKNFLHLITFVSDRPGHDTRYAIDNSKIIKEFKFTKKFNFEEKIKNTINWYLANKKWWQNIINKKKYKLKRIGLKRKV